MDSNIAGVPFKHFVLRLAEDADSEYVHEAYKRLLDSTREFQIASDCDTTDYNVAMTRDWITVIPRRTQGPDGPYGSNAAGMLGLLHVPDASDKAHWERLGYARYLEYLGYPAG